MPDGGATVIRFRRPRISLAGSELDRPVHRSIRLLRTEPGPIDSMAALGESREALLRTMAVLRTAHGA